ncbi:MAG: hypothetical protein IMF11_06990 [Proteobacteria bacterium]|nr:hypothetical protein [Pseudomonadota bacterium]
MASPKARTIQQRFGFADGDLKTPKHDEIMLWLDKKVDECLPLWLGIGPKWTNRDVADVTKRIEQLQSARLAELNSELEQVSKGESLGPLPSRLAIGRELSPGEIQEWKDSRKQERTRELKLKVESVSKWKSYPPLPERPEITGISKKWEKPITTGGSTYYSDRASNKYVVGFVDLAVSCKIPHIDLENAWESRVPDDWQPTWTIYSHEKTTIYFEVKTEIKSLGELIRQINMYREYASGQFFVVSPDDQYAEILREQRIGLIKYSP